MVFKIVFLVLVGCAFALSKPIEETEVAEVKKPEIEVIEIPEEEAKEIFKRIEEKIKGIWEKVTIPTNPGDIKTVFEDIKSFFDKIFGEHKQPQKSVESVESPESNEPVKSVESPVSVKSKESVESQKPVEEVTQENQQ